MSKKVEVLILDLLSISMSLSAMLGDEKSIDQIKLLLNSQEEINKLLRTMYSIKECKDNGDKIQVNVINERYVETYLGPSGDKPIGWNIGAIVKRGRAGMGSFLYRITSEGRFSTDNGLWFFFVETMMPDGSIANTEIFSMEGDTILENKDHDLRPEFEAGYLQQPH